MTAEQYLEETASRIRGVITELETATAEGRAYEDPPFVSLELFNIQSTAVLGGYAVEWLEEVTAHAAVDPLSLSTTVKWEANPVGTRALYCEHSFIGSDSRLYGHWDLYIPCARAISRPDPEHTFIPVLNLHRTYPEPPAHDPDPVARRRDTLLSWVQEVGDVRELETGGARFQAWATLSMFTLLGLFSVHLTAWPIVPGWSLPITELAALPVVGVWSLQAQEELDRGVRIQIDLAPSGRAIVAWVAGDRISWRLRANQFLTHVPYMPYRGEVRWWEAMSGYGTPGQGGNPPQQIAITTGDYYYIARPSPDEASISGPEAEEFARQMATGKVFSPGIILWRDGGRVWLIRV